MAQEQISIEKFEEVLQRDNDKEIQEIVKVLQETDQVEEYAKKLNAFLVAKWNERIAVEIEQVEKVQTVNIITVYMEFYDEMIHKQEITFMNNQIFVEQMKNAFKSIVNDNKFNNWEKGSFPSYIFVNYFHEILTTPHYVHEMKNIMEECKKVVDLLPYILNKDVFESDYHDYLLYRLSSGKFNSIDTELEMITLLESIFEESAIDSYRNICKEYTECEKYQEEFKKFCMDQKIELPIESEFGIFQKSRVYNSKYSYFQHPQPCKEIFDLHKKFYSNKSKRLIIDVLKTTGIIKFMWMKRPIELHCSYIQIAILLAFNEKEEYTYEELQTKIDVEKDDFNYNISGLLLHDVIVSSTGKNILPESTFKFNMEFKPQTTKINVTKGNESYYDEYSKLQKEEKDIEKERAFKVQAVAVRLLKAKKVMKYTDLINAIIEQLKDRFTASASLIRHQIEYLMNKEYFKRSETDPELIEFIF